LKKFVVLFLLFSVVYASESIPTQYYDTFMNYCTEYEVSPYYMNRLISYESGWNPKHKNKNSNGTVGYGLTQLNSAGMNDLSRWHNEGKSFDPMDWNTNLRIGVKHLRYLYDLTGSWWGAIAAYNMGYNGWKDWCAGKRSLPKSTQNELNYVFQ
jgi:soluble lytic murein transglycosylase-like protein